MIQPQWDINPKDTFFWFAIDLTSKFQVESSSRFHRFGKANPRGNHDIDATRKFRHGFDFQNRQNIDEFSTWIFPIYHFLTFSALGTYSKLIWYSAESILFRRYWRNHWYWNYSSYILWEFSNNTNNYE